MAIDEALVLTLMRFPDELADPSDFRFPPATGQRPKEVQMAKVLIDQLSAKWPPREYKDEYQANLARVLRAKLKGTVPRLREELADTRRGKVVDLVERLQQSLAGRRRARGVKRRAKTSRKSGSRKVA